MNAPQRHSEDISRAQTAQAIAQRFALAASLAAISVYLYLGVHVLRHEYFSYDSIAMHYFQRHQTRPLHFLMRWVFTELGGTFLVTALTAILTVRLIAVKRFKPEGAVLVAAILGGLVLMETMKHLFPRPRAFHVDDHLGSSFPSGHVFFAITLYGLLCWRLTARTTRRVRVLAWSSVLIITLLVGFSRIYVGAHYPTDVLAGMMMAVPWLCGWIAVLKQDRFRENLS